MNDAKSNSYPQWILRVLENFCPNYLYEEIEGDLIEKYNQDLKTLGQVKARRRFVWNAVRFFRPGIIFRNNFSYQLINTMMLRNYLTIAFRNVAKNKVFSAINVLGLGIGLAACMLIFQFVTFELSYDKFNEKFDRIYRITNDRFQNGKLIQHGTITYPTIGPTMAKDYPEIENHTRLMPGGNMNIKVDDKNFKGDDCHFVDENFLTVFSFDLFAGDRSTCLKDPYSLVISETLAKKYFNSGAGDYNQLLGRTLYWGLDTQPYKVTGICANVPSNSHIRFDALVSYSTLIKPDQQGADISWTWSDFRHYIVLKPGVDYKSLEAKFDQFSDRYFQGDKVSGSVEKFFLQPLPDAHLYSDYEYDIAFTASGKAVWGMLIVSIFILLIGWINYINLTTSRALDRAKEVGLRKVMGAVKGQLIKQFIFESVVISFFAFVVAVIIVQLSQGAFNNIIKGNVTFWRVLADLDFSSLTIIIAVMLVGVLLAGFYPAFVLSSYQPATVLKGKFQRSSSGKILRKGLVVFQFTASVTLIIGTVIVAQQLKYMNEADLGININDIMVVEAPELARYDSTFIERVESYKQELNNLNGVVSVTTSFNLPGDRLGRGFDIRLAEQASSTNYTVSFISADHNFHDTYGVSLIAGRKFSPSDHKVNGDDINTVIINERVARMFGVEPDLIVGKEVLLGARPMTIVGVVNDFHQESLKTQKEPIMFVPSYGTYATTSIKIRQANSQQLVNDVENIYKKFYPNNAFVYFFLEDRYKAQYNDEERFSKVITIFTALGILISCLGLVGLSSYTAVQRTKEIGIRKALGASLLNIISLLSSDFIRLVLIAILLSMPLAYFAIQSWLANYPYKIALQWFLFVIPSIVILAIAAFTISFQVLKTARVNPANTLKYE